MVSAAHMYLHNVLSYHLDGEGVWRAESVLENSGPLAVLKLCARVLALWWQMVLGKAPVWRLLRTGSGRSLDCFGPHGNDPPIVTLQAFGPYSARPGLWRCHSQVTVTRDGYKWWKERGGGERTCLRPTSWVLRAGCLTRLPASSYASISTLLQVQTWWFPFLL